MNHTKSSFLVLISLTCILLAVECAPVAIITHIKSQNVSLGDKAFFHCVVMNADYLIWYINGTEEMNKVSTFSLNYSEYLSNSIQPTVSNLTISITEAAVSVLNNTDIYCVGLNSSNRVLSTASLLVQGPLDAPVNVKASYTNSAFDISWSAPYTLEGITITCYHVSITRFNTSDAVPKKENVSVITSDDTETVFGIFDGGKWNICCIVYEICVQAKTAAGLGGSSCINASYQLAVINNLQSTNVSFGSHAYFSCSVMKADVILWYVNGTHTKYSELPFGYAPYVDKSVQPTTSNLTVLITGLAEVLLNNTDFYCLGVNTSVPYIVESSAKLLIQGTLDAPKNLHSSFSPTMIITSWDAPFSLEGIPITYYQVNITRYNITSVGQSTQSIAHLTTEGTSIYFQDLMDSSSCIVYETCVQAITEAGFGKAACVNESRIIAPQVLEQGSVSVTVTFMRTAILVQFDFVEYCPSQRAVSAGVDIYVHSFVPFIKMDNLTVMNDGNGSDYLNVLLENSVQGSNATTIITLVNSAGYTESNPIEISLFNLQGVRISMTTTGTLVMCFFAVNSAASGCFLALECVEDQNIKCEIVVIRESPSSLNASQVVSGCQRACSVYNLFAKDIFSDGSKDSMVAVTLKNISVPYLRPVLHDTEATDTPTIRQEPNDLTSDDNLTYIRVMIVLSTVIVICIALLILFVVVFILLYKRKGSKTEDDSVYELKVCGDSKIGLQNIYQLDAESAIDAQELNTKLVEEDTPVSSDQEFSKSQLQEDNSKNSSLLFPHMHQQLQNQHSSHSSSGDKEIKEDSIPLQPQKDSSLVVAETKPQLQLVPSELKKREPSISDVSCSEELEQLEEKPQPNNMVDQQTEETHLSTHDGDESEQYKLEEEEEIDIEESEHEDSSLRAQGHPSLERSSPQLQLVQMDDEKQTEISLTTTRIMGHSYLDINFPDDSN